MQINLVRIYYCKKNLSHRNTIRHFSHFIFHPGPLIYLYSISWNRFWIRLRPFVEIFESKTLCSYFTKSIRFPTTTRCCLQTNWNGFLEQQNQPWHMWNHPYSNSFIAWRKKIFSALYGKSVELYFNLSFIRNGFRLKIRGLDRGQHLKRFSIIAISLRYDIALSHSAL